MFLCWLLTFERWAAWEVTMFYSSRKTHDESLLSGAVLVKLFGVYIFEIWYDCVAPGGVEVKIDEWN